MGNQCCGNQPINRDANEQAFASAIPVRLQPKLKPESGRFYQIMLAHQQTQNPNSFLSTERSQEFILNLKPYSNLATNDSVSVTLKVVTHDYSYKDDLDWFIDENVIIDPNSFEGSLLRVTDKRTGNKFTLRVINFEDYEDYSFKQTLYQIYIMQQIGKSPAAKSLVQLMDCYILENQEKEHNKGSIVILMEDCESTLHEIISFRKFHNWPWTHEEIKTIFGELAQALSQLEQLNICHRDIRPHNIWYCPKSQSYKLGGFDDAKIIKKEKNNQSQLGLQNIGLQIQSESEELLNTVRGVPDYMPPEVQKYVEAGGQNVGNYNPFLSDVYQLGLNILMMELLELNFENADLRNQVKKFNQNRSGSRSGKDYKDLLKLMLVGDEKSRLTPAELALFTKAYVTENSVNEENLLQSMRYKKKYSGIESNKVYKLIAIAYYDLFEWEKWQEKMEEILASYENAKDQPSQALILFDIATGYSDINNLQSAQDYYMKAAVLYNEIGHAQREENQQDDAIESYEQALDCIRRAHNGDESYEGALLLENLANIYRLKGNLIRSRSYLEEACRITSEEKGEDSLEFAKMTINLGRVHTLLADYKHAMKRIKKGLKIAEAHAGNAKNNMDNSMISYQNTTASTSNTSQLLKAQALTSLGEIQRLKGSLGKAKKNIEEALGIREKLQGNGNLEVAATIENLGNVYFEMEDYHQSKSQYERALVIKKSKLGDIHIEIALTLNNIGNSCKHLGENEKAQKFFTDALAILKQAHQTEDHPLVAATYGNLGILLKGQGNQKGAQVCLEKCVNIMDKTVPQGHPDHEFYREHLAQSQV